MSVLHIILLLSLSMWQKLANLVKIRRSSDISWVIFLALPAVILYKCEPHQESGKPQGARGNILTGPLWGDNVWISFLKMVHSGVLYIFERRQPPNVAETGVT